MLQQSVEKQMHVISWTRRGWELWFQKEYGRIQDQ